MDLFEGLDWGTYYFFRFQANSAPHLQGLMQIGDLIGSYLGAVVLLPLAVAATRQSGRWRMALVVVAAFFFGGMLVEGTKVATQRPRPLDAQNILGTPEMSSSFPSRAVFLAAFAWLILAAALERRTTRKSFRIAIYLAAAPGIVFVCVSELWLGLHFVTDVLAGLAGGIGLALVARWAALEPASFNPEPTATADAPRGCRPPCRWLRVKR
jgi:undecaprenyl-diphosphatase